MRFAVALVGSLLLVVSSHGEEEQAGPKSRIERAVEEFKVETRNLGLRADSPRRAQRNGGAKAKFNGRVFHNFRNDFLDAVPKEIRQSGGGKNLLRRNQFGFNLTGPVILPKLYNGGRRTFFSISFEGVRERIGRSFLRTVPTLPERTGDFSQVVDQAGAPLPVYDPRTTRPNPSYNASQAVSEQNLQYLRGPFPGNVLPTARLDSDGQRALGFYPHPNTDVGPFFRNNYFVVSPQSNSANGMIVRIDHTLRERHRLNVNASFSNGLAGAARFFDTPADSSSPDREYQNRRGSVEYSFSISPRTVNTVSFEAASDRAMDVSQASDFAASVGVTAPGSGVFPVIRFSPYLAMGNSNPSGRNARNSFVYSDAFSTRLRNHNLRAIAEFVQFQVNTHVPQYPAGSFQFGAGLTSLPGINNTGHAFASYLLGLAEYAEVSLVESPSYFRKSRFSLALRDQYEVRPGLTVTLSVNTEINTPRTEKFDHQSTVDLDAVNPANGRDGALAVANRGRYGRSLQPVVTIVEPSASIAWSPGGSSKRVFRAAYSRSYQSLPIYSAQFGTQGFNGYDTFFSPNVQLEPAVIMSQGMPSQRQLPNLNGDAANDTVADYLDPSENIPTYQSASLSAESQLPGSMVFTGGVYYSGGRNLLVSNGTVNLNAIHPDNLVYRDKLNDELFRRSLRPYPQYLGFDVYSSYPAGRYHRHAAYGRLEKRTSSGLSLNVYYEYGKQYDDYSGPYGRQDFFNRRNEESLTAGIPLDRLSMSYVYELPIGSNKPFLAYNDWRRVLVDGWSLSGVSTVSGGDPIALRPQFNNTGGIIPYLNVNVVPGADPVLRDRSAELWFNPTAFAQPADFTLGDASRTHPSLRNPGSQIHDLSVSKRFSLAPERTLEFTASGFNFINHANWNDPDVVIGPSDAPNINAGKIIGSRGGRVVQIGLRFSF